jgi:hypothetical protein
MVKGILLVPTIILNKIDTRLGYTEQVNVKKILRVLVASVLVFNLGAKIKIHLIQ